MKHTELRAMASASAVFRAMASANTLPGALAEVLWCCWKSDALVVGVLQNNWHHGHQMQLFVSVVSGGMP